MADRDSDHMEKIQLWWMKYRFYVLVGMAMILALITGFTLRHSSHDAHQQQANIELFALLQAAEDNEVEVVEEKYATLLADENFPELSVLAGFALVSVYVEEERYEEAKDALQTVLDTSDDDGIKQLAALRMSEVLINMDAQEEAVDLLEFHTPSTGRLRVLFSERLGDAEFSRGNRDEAEEAYLRALSLASESATFYVPVLRIKISALLSSSLDNTKDTKDGEDTENAESNDTPDTSDSTEESKEKDEENASEATQ